MGFSKYGFLVCAICLVFAQQCRYVCIQLVDDIILDKKLIG
jgi:hypothetical protein